MEISDLKKITKPIFYVTNDVGRGIGLESFLPSYHIVCLDDHPLVDYLQEAGVSVFCLERALGRRNALARTAGNILAQPAVLAFVKEKSQGKVANILFFKPQKKIEVLAKKHRFNLLGNSVEVNRLFEDKVAFFEFCQKEGLKTIPGELALLSSLDFRRLVSQYGRPLAIQFGRGWAGNSTFFILAEEELERLKERYGPVRVRVNKFIEGITILNNAVVFGKNVLVSRPALQIKPHPLLTSAPGGTGGRQWPAPLTKEQEKEIWETTQQLGRLMGGKGYRGFFGLDFLIEEKSKAIFLSENNARLTASVPFYTKLELGAGAFPLLGYHLLSFLGETSSPPDFESPAVFGSEIIMRNTEKFPVKISTSPSTGLYNEDFEFKKRTYFLETSEESDFWLEAAAEGRVVNPEIELAKIDTLAKVCREDGSLQEKYRQILKKLKEDFKLEKCGD